MLQRLLVFMSITMPSKSNQYGYANAIAFDFILNYWNCFSYPNQTIKEI